MTSSTESIQGAVPASSPQLGQPSSLDFYALGRSVQDRFLASASGTGVPKVILFSPAGRSTAFGWLALAILGPIALFALLLFGLGQLYHSLAIQPLAMVLVAALVAGGAAFGIAGYLENRSRGQRFPFRLGSYVFPIGVVEAESATLKVWPFTSMTELRQQGEQVVFQFPGRSFTFKLPKEFAFAELQDIVDASTQQFRVAAERQNRRELAVLDPLRDSGFSNPLSSTQPFSRPKDRRMLKLSLALCIGAALGVLLFFVRNKLGERLIYQEAVEANTSKAYNAYLARGGKRIDVQQTLLPTAELAEIRGSLEAVERYAEKHPDSAIRPQIDLALREEMLNELDRVRAAGSLEAILQFKEKHPRHALVAAELGQVRKQVYRDAVESYKENSVAGDRVKAFFVDLIGYSEQHGPRVEVRVRREIPPSHERADSSIRKSAYYMGLPSLPSQYFNEEHARPREQQATKQIIEGLQQGFSKEILTFTEGEPAAAGADLPDVEVPTLFITYRPEMSGGYTTQRPRGVYVGLGFMVYTQFLIPKHDRPLNIKKQSWWLPPDVTQIWAEQMSTAQVYDQSAREGFKRYVEKLLSILMPAAPDSSGGEPELD